MRHVVGHECDFDVVEGASDLQEVLEVVQVNDLIAIDTEVMVKVQGGSFTDPHACEVRLLQLGFHDRDPIIIDRLTVDLALGAGPGLLDTLSKKELVAHNAPYDYKQVLISMGVRLSNLRCSKVAMQTLALASGYKSWMQRGFTYGALCRDILGVRVDKALQASNWGAPTLTHEQYEYAALDVGAPRGRAKKSLLLQGYCLLKRESDKMGMGEVWDLRQALVPIIGDMELEGLLLDMKLLQELKEVVGEHVRSSTQELCKVLGLEVYTTMGVKADGSWGVTLTPTQKSAKLLNHKAGLLNHINKALGGYGIVLTDLSEDSLKPHLSIPLVGTLAQYSLNHKLLGDVGKYMRASNPITGYVHFETNIVGTSTGRMSGCSDEDATDKLSVQQMSGKAIKLGGDRKVSLRGCVMAKPGGVILDLDFSAQELRIAAGLSGDTRMLNTFMLERDNPYLIHPETGEKYANPMTDLHLVATLSMGPYEYLKDLPLWEVGAACRVKGADGKAPRDKGKTFNFSVVYGASALSVAEDLGVTQKEAEVFLKGYFDNFPQLRKWLVLQANTANDLRWLQLPMGAQIFANEVNAKGSGDKGAISRRAGNIPIQGTGALMMALAIKYQSERLGPLLHHNAFIYDGMLCEIPLPKGEDAKDGNGNWNPYVLDIAQRAKQCLLDAEDHILSPYIGQPFPCAADSKLSMYWDH